MQFGRIRRPLAVLAVCSLALAAAACSGDDDDTTPASRPKRTTTTTPIGAEVTLTRGEVTVSSAGGDVALDDATQQAVVDAAQHYVDIATLAPLVDGAVGAGYEELFDTAVRTDATGPHRPALTDEGVPVTTTRATVTATPVRIDALADKDGHVLYVATSFDLDVRARSADGPVTLHRTNELTFAPVDASWLVTAYQVTVERDVPEAAPTTTTVSAGTTETTA